MPRSIISHVIIVIIIVTVTYFQSKFSSVCVCVCRPRRHRSAILCACAFVCLGFLLTWEKVNFIAVVFVWGQKCSFQLFPSIYFFFHFIFGKTFAFVCRATWLPSFSISATAFLPTNFHRGNISMWWRGWSWKFMVLLCAHWIIDLTTWNNLAAINLIMVKRPLSGHNHVFVVYCRLRFAAVVQFWTTLSVCVRAMRSTFGTQHQPASHIFVDGGIDWRQGEICGTNSSYDKRNDSDSFYLKFQASDKHNPDKTMF